MKEERRWPSLDRPVIYQIKVPSKINEHWSDWIVGMSISFEIGDDGRPK
jgi:hypothetical protein